MLYQAFQAMQDMLAPARLAAGLIARATEVSTGQKGALPWAGLMRADGAAADGQRSGVAEPWVRRVHALAETFGAAKFTHAHPGYNIGAVQVGNRMVPVREEIVLDAPFGNLLHFAKGDPDDDTLPPQPKMLVVAPLSGHYATLLRSTVTSLLRDHDVYITDWKNARDIPVAEGRFGFDEYVDYTMRFMRELGPNSHMISVCQPCVPALVAVAVMAQDKDPCQPRTMTLMGGPIDTRVGRTVVNELSAAHTIDWFRANLISAVPRRWKGRGRRVYPGFLQLTAFMSMNMGRHMDQFRKFYQALADGDTAAAEGIRDFYTEYFAVLDLTEEFYLDTVERVFINATLAEGRMEFRGRKVDCGAIYRTALLTVEGERDDICGVGQTAAAHLLCTGLRPHMKRHYLQPNVGHYGIFAGSKWDRQVYPQVKAHVLAMG